jgi:hypothetical protein
MSLDPPLVFDDFRVYCLPARSSASSPLTPLMCLAPGEPVLLSDIVGAEHFHDLGKLLFAFTVFLGVYRVFQFFLIWYGNIPEETIFFRHRLVGSWKAVSMLLAAGHFVIPFFFFMPRT